MKNYTQEMLAFIKNSPSCFHAVENVVSALTEHGFTELCENELWDIKRGGKYFVTRNKSSIIAFSVPEKIDKPKFMVVASHSDSPTFKIKDTPELEGAYTRINTERYGGMILDSWLDRPLSVAGRVMVRTENGVSCRLVNIDRDLLLIPHVAIHMENPNEGKAYSPASDMVPLYGSAAAKGTFMPLIAEAIGEKAEDIVSHELFLYCRTEPSIWGAQNEYVSSPKLDDLACAYSSLEALTEAKVGGAIPVMFIADNEEVGSGTKQGADSTFLRDTLSRICDAMGGDLRVAAAHSMMLSADNAHAVHPNNPSLSDPVHKPEMNKGIVIKYNASQLYTTDAISSAIFREICARADVPTQVFANRSDKRGGSTLGNISNSQVSMLAVDIGIAQLAMHSAYESAGSEDVAYMVAAMKKFFETELQISGDDVIIK